MQRADLPVVGGLHEDVVTKINAERTINSYVVNFPQGKKPQYLHPIPGKRSIATFSEGAAGRASITFKGFVYFVVGDTIYRMDSTLVVSIIGLNFFLTASGHVGVAANENQILFVDGDKAFLWHTLTNTSTDVTPNLPAGFSPYDVDMMDGYFLLISKALTFENRFHISALNDGTTWPVLDFALINSRPTVLNGVKLLKRRVFFFGETKSELWGDAGDSDFPFRRDNNLLLEHGVRATSSITQGFEMMFYLSGDNDGVGSIMMVRGTTPVPISTPQMDEFIQTFIKPEDATGFVYKVNGQIFYQINFTEDDHTYLYNVNSESWSEMTALDGTRDISNTHSFFENNSYVTAYNINKLYHVSPAYLDNDGEKIKHTRIMRLLSAPTYERITYARLQIDMLKGVGLINTKGLNSFPPTILPPQSASDVDPVIFLSVSEDGGITYFSFGTSSFGRAGDRLIRIIWDRLGAYRDAIFKIEIFNDVPVYILGGAIDYEKEPQ
jgi:hypothetical protein